MEHITTDILVVGGGVAGCFSAIKARERGTRRVLLIDKGYVGMSGCSKFAAGSLKAFIPGEDDYNLWFSKSVEDGGYLNDQQWTETHLKEVYDRVKELDAWGVQFLKDRNGKFERLEGSGFSKERPIRTIMFHGPQMMDVLRETALKLSVDILDKTMITHLIHDRQDPRRVAGALGFDLRTGQHKAFTAKATVLTAGAQAFKSHNAYQKMVTGDAHIMGMRAGAQVANYEFTCHQLSCAEFDTAGMNVLLGLGATFVNSKGEAFMKQFDPEHGDRSTVNRISAAMGAEVSLGHGPISLDISRFSRESLAYFQKTLPIIYRAFERAGVIRDGDLKKGFLEWVSVNMGNVAHGGGLRINLNCETTLKGLFAAGDATNRPASGVEGIYASSIPFATTSGARSGVAASDYVRDAEEAVPSGDEIRTFGEELSRPFRIVDGVEPDYVTLKVQEILFPMGVYLIRHQDRLQKALEGIYRLRDDIVPFLKAYDSHYLRMAVEASHMVRSGEMFLRAAIERTESRGPHFREDYPEMDNVNWLRWVILGENEGALTVSTENIPIGSYRLQPEKQKHLHSLAQVMRRMA